LLYLLDESHNRSPLFFYTFRCGYQENWRRENMFF